MDERRKKIQHLGRQIDVTEIPFETPAEHWNEYLVDDGSVIKLKTITGEILRIDGEYDTEGNPLYLVKSTNVVTVSAPEKPREVRGRRLRTRYENQLVDAIEIPFQTGAEFWSEYQLKDGSAIKLKTVTTEILRIEGQRDAEGNFIYIVKSRNIVTISASESLRRDPSGG